MVAPDGTVDAALTAYFNSAKFRRLADDTKRSYTTDYRLFFNFLWQRGKSWRAAAVDDVEDFEDWRRRAADNPRRVGGAKWSRELAAIHRLYRWAVSARVVVANPVVSSIRVGRDGSEIESLDAAAHDVRSSNVKWLTPRASARWRNVGLLGYTADDVPDPSFRGRNGDRNAAFVDLLFDSGLRVSEAGTLLDLEVPVEKPSARYHWSRVASEVAKYHSGRPFCATTATLARIRAYQTIDRAELVQAAQRSGRYDRMERMLLVTKVRTAQELIVEWVDRDNGVVQQQPMDRIRKDERRRMFREGAEGLEPLSLWLGQNGLPFTPHSWEAVFSRATGRCEAVLGAGAPYCTPHMARHSFALQMLVAIQHIMDTRFGFDAQQRRDFEANYGNPWRMVKDLLGHRSEETTRNIYLAPVRDVQIRTLLEGDLAAGVEFLQALAAASGRIQDVTA